MFEIFHKIQKKIETCLVYGPCNYQSLEAARLHSASHRLFQPEVKCRSTASYSSSILSQRIRAQIYPMNRRSTTLLDMSLKGVWSGTGTCETYAILGAVFLAQMYQVDVSIENIHSDLTHTYLRVHTQPHEYIFDFWSNSVVRYGNWLEWNESVDYEYRHTAQARFSLLAHNISQEALHEIYWAMNAKEQIARRNNHLEHVNSVLKLERSPAPSPTSITDGCSL